jgi:RNA recognition motif-containing protein
MNSKLYVGNLSNTTTEDALLNLFSQSGTVVSVDLIRDPLDKRSKGYAFIVMSNQAEAYQAIEMLDGNNLDNTQIRVSFAKRSEGLNDRDSSKTERGKAKRRE